MSRVVGHRIGAYLGASNKVLRFLGYGTYQGDEVPPEDIGGFNIGMPNPKLLLDNGKIVWGCECWWGGEDRIKAEIDQHMANGYAIETVDIDAARAAAR